MKKVIKKRKNRQTNVDEMLVEFDAPTKYVEWIDASQYDGGSIIE